MIIKLYIFNNINIYKSSFIKNHMVKKDKQTQLSDFIKKQISLDLIDYEKLKKERDELRKRDRKKYSMSDALSIILDERRSQK